MCAGATRAPTDFHQEAVAHDGQHPTAPRGPDRNLALELVRVTEAAAMAAGRWVGRGDKEGGDGAAVDAMRHMVSSVSMQASS